MNKVDENVLNIFLKNKGYKWAIMMSNDKTEFHATKANKKKDGSFPDSSRWDTYKLDKNEKWISKGRGAYNKFLEIL